MPKINAQVADYAQVLNNYVYLNPSFVGMTTCPHVFTSYRNKYVSQADYSSTYLSFDMGLKNYNANMGVSLLHDVQNNAFRETEILGIYAHTFRLKKKLYLNASLAAGYVYGATDYSNFVFPDMLDVNQDEIGTSGESFEWVKRHDFNSEFGLLLFNDDFYAGMTIKNLQGNFTAANENENYFPRIYSFHGMTRISTTKAFLLRYLIWFYPHMNIVIGGSSSYTQLGLILQKWMIQAGGAYRQNFAGNENSFVFFVGVVEKKFRFAYNCDLTRNSIKQFDTHEVSLSYQFDCREKKKKFEAVKAPTF